MNNSMSRFKGRFNAALLPSPGQYYRKQGLILKGGSEWKSAICPFHPDTKPSLRVRLDSGGFKCMACNVHGGGIVDFHMKRYNLDFVPAVKELGAWRHG